MRRFHNLGLLCSSLVWGLLMSLPAHAQAVDSGWATVALPAAQQLDIRARTTGYPYRILMSVPDAPAPKQGYPVLYVLDGNAAFPVAAFLARSVASRRDVTGHQPPLVVGIGYPGDRDFDVAARQRDYTPGAQSPHPPATEGGADHFLDFIDREVKPMVAARYPIDTQRQALFGHSFGGLLALHALLTRPTSFSTYLLSSPSIWWQDKRVLAGWPNLARSAARPRVQISVGALEDDPPKRHYPPEVRALWAQRPMVMPARHLAHQLRELPGWSDANTVYYELAGENHGPAWLPAMTRGMQFFMEQAPSHSAAATP